MVMVWMMVVVVDCSDGDGNDVGDEDSFLKSHVLIVVESHLLHVYL